MNTKRRELTAEEEIWRLNLNRIWDDRRAQAKAAKSTLNQDIVADLAGWRSQSSFSQYLTGKIPLNTEAIFTLSRALDFDPPEVNPKLPSNRQAWQVRDTEGNYVATSNLLDAIRTFGPNAPLDEISESFSMLAELLKKHRSQADDIEKK
jgi:hypothetical protein